MPVTIVRNQAQRDRVSALKTQCRDLVAASGRVPGSSKILTAISLMLLDYMADMPGAEVRLRQTLDGLRLYAGYKQNRKRDKRG